MASISKVVKITVSLLTASIKEAGFGLPMFADYHNRFSERIRFYEDLTGMAGDGFLTSDAAYMAAAAAFAQQPSPEEIAIGRRLSAPALAYVLTPTAINSKNYKLTMTGPTGVVTVVNFTSDGTATVAEIVAGLVAAINAVAGTPFAAVDTGATHTTVTVTATAGAGTWFGIEVLEDGVSAGHAGILLKQTHADPGIATDLAGIQGVDDTWYGFCLTTEGAAEIAAASAWAESNDKQMIQATQDADCIDSGTGDIMSTCKTANRFRTGLLYHENPTQMAGAAWMGSVFPIDPGGVTYAFRQLRSVDSSPLSTTQMTNLENKNGNYFVDIGGVGVTFGRNGGGMAASGEWLDIIRDTDWYEVQIGVEVLKVNLANNKVPMTNDGIQLMATALRTATTRAEDAGFLDSTQTAYTIPDISQISTNDRANRTLNKLKVQSRVQGAIHITDVTATITE